VGGEGGRGGGERGEERAKEEGGTREERKIIGTDNQTNKINKMNGNQMNRKKKRTQHQEERKKKIKLKRNGTQNQEDRKIGVREKKLPKFWTNFGDQVTCQILHDNSGEKFFHFVNHDDQFVHVQGCVVHWNGDGVLKID
jgi:hypothetical protein